MPKTVGPDGEVSKAFSVMLPETIYEALIKDGKENERTLSQTVRWGLKYYVEAQEMAKKRRIRYGTGLPTYSYPRSLPGNNTLSGPLTDFEDAAYDKETADADEIKEMLDTNET